MAGEVDDTFDFEVEEIMEVVDKQDAEKPAVIVEDDTPEADRGREPMPKDIVDDLEADELEDYSEKVKLRLKQMKKVWHDERREKERVQREQNEAVSAMQRIMEENRALRNTLSQGEQELVGSYKQATELELATARKAYEDAYEAGDGKLLVAAQEQLTAATYKMNQLNSYRPTLQQVEEPVYSPQQQVQIPRPDQKTMAWQERNTWWGVDQEMTAAALGLHQKLAASNGADYVGSDSYWSDIDATMRKRFPEYFGGSEKQVADTPKQRSATVVAPASRSTSPKKIVLKQSQLAIARKLGLTPEQYAREVMKLES